MNNIEDITFNNLKLLKTNIIKELDLNFLKNLKVLIFGAGCLGCAVARTLLTYNINSISFIDNGIVSHSNVIRQILYDSDDIGKYKANVISEKLQKIYKNINCKGYNITIPSPDHPILNTEYEDTINNINEIKLLIKENDILFLLTDNMESRWLPTMFGTYFNKKIITVGLSPENFVIIEHNHNSGCYFCSQDTITNSVINKSYDQRCTVVRGGLALLSSSLCVELLITNLFKNKKIYQIRGSLENFDIKEIKSERYQYCIACSDHIKNLYEKYDINFILQACNKFEIIKNIFNEINNNNVICEEEEFITFEI
jgi:ubiquitin-like modifier-activating enzyme ATG7